MRPVLLAHLAVWLLACAATAAGAQTTPPAAAPLHVAGADFHDVRKLPPSAVVQLSGWSGAVEATGVDGDTLDVQAVFSGRDGARMKVALRQEAAGVAVCVLFAEDSPDVCHLGEIVRGPHAGVHDSVDVRLVARIPRGARLVAETLNGRVAATGLTSDVNAKSTNGDVVVSTAGSAVASTTNGAVDASIGAATPGPLSFTSTNGRVRVSLPARIDADVEAGTTNGSIHANFPISVEGPPFAGPRQGRARLGRGGRRVEARTNNGDVELHAGD
jgi:hypothetical protein